MVEFPTVARVCRRVGHLHGHSPTAAPHQNEPHTPACLSPCPSLLCGPRYRPDIGGATARGCGVILAATTLPPEYTVAPQIGSASLALLACSRNRNPIAESPAFCALALLQAPPASWEASRASQLPFTASSLQPWGWITARLQSGRLPSALRIIPLPRHLKLCKLIYVTLQTVITNHGEVAILC